MSHCLLGIIITTIFLIAGCAAENQRVNILYVGDLQYNIFPVTATNSLCESGKDCTGGLGRLLALHESINGDYEVSLLLSVGGALDGEWYNILKCQTISEAMHLANFDAVALDAEMFQYGYQVASPCLEILNDKLLSANSGVYTKSKAQKYNETLMIGIIGFTNEEKLKEFSISNATDAVKAVETELKALKEKSKTQFHIAIGATTLEKARDIASIAGINLVLLSGNSSGITADDDEFMSEKVDDDTYIACLDISSTGAVPNFHANFITLEFDPEKSVISSYNNTVTDYADLSLQGGDLDVFLQTKMTVLTTPVVTPIVDITSDGCNTQECLLGNLFADAIVSAVQDPGTSTSWEEAIKIAVVPGASLSNINFTKGEISVEYIYEFFNPDISIHSVSLNGKQLKQLFDTAVGDYGQTSTAKNFLQVSGLISVEFDFKGKKVTQIKTVTGSFLNATKLLDVDLNDEKTNYLIAFPVSLLEISSYQYLKGLSQELGVTMGGAIEEYFRGIKYLTFSPVGQRIKQFTPPTDTKTCPNNTAEAVLLTLFIMSLMAGLGYVTWRIVIPRVRARRNSTLPLVGGV